MEGHEQNFILRIDLNPRFITNPRVCRTLSCPAAATFASFHIALQVAFDWANSHLHEFEVLDHNDAKGSEDSMTIARCILKITDLSTLEEEEDSDNESDDDSVITLSEVLNHPHMRGNTIHYNYDLGDGWEHVITCIGRSEPTTNFVCLDGEGHGCAEDVGGWFGWKELLEAFDAENPTKTQQDHCEWFKSHANNKDPEGLRGEAKWKWDKERINAVLAELNSATAYLDAAQTVASQSILLISLHRPPYFDKMFSETIATLRSRATVVEVTHIASTLDHLAVGQRYAAIIATDAALLDKAFIAVAEKLVEYAWDGGTVILGFQFSNSCTLPDLKAFFKNSWSLTWEGGSYQRDSYAVNRRANARFTGGKYPNLKPYSMKALSLKNIKVEDRVYLSTNMPRDESPAVFARYGNSGHLGWIGDVNTEGGTTELLLAMCNL
jgi:hypothetical protein